MLEFPMHHAEAVHNLNPDSAGLEWNGCTPRLNAIDSSIQPACLGGAMHTRAIETNGQDGSLVQVT